MFKIYLINFLLLLYKYITFSEIFTCFIFYFITYLGGPLFVKLFQIFNSFHKLDCPIENGSIGKITYDNSFVKKELHKNISENMIDSLIFFKNFLIINKIKFPFYYQEFFDINMEQIDLRKEREYSIKLKEIFKNINNVKIINIILGEKDYHISDFIEGIKINKFLEKKENLIYEKEIYRLLYLSYYLMLSANLFHCDWHYGNFLVNIDSSSKINLYILDTGLMGNLKYDYFNKLKVLLKTNMLKPEPINLVKFLCYTNKNENANLKDFIKKSKEKIKILEANKDYKSILLEIIKYSSKFNLKYPILILYMFQSIIFLNNINESIQDDILVYSKKFGFYNEIIKYIS